MKFIRIATLAGLLVAAMTNCYATEQADAGHLKFQGGLLDAGCMAQRGHTSALELKGCPLASRGMVISVQRVQLSGRRKVLAEFNAKLIADTGPVGRHFDQSYALTDTAGHALRTGNYVVTMTTP